MEEVELRTRLTSPLPYTEDLPPAKHRFSVQRIPVGSRVSLASTRSYVASSVSLQADSTKTPSLNTNDIPIRDAPSSSSATDWKPRSLRLPYLLLLALFHAVTLAVVEIPVQVLTGKQSEGRTSFGGNDSGHYFLWQFLPILWVTGLSVVWDALDEDIRRLQPFFLMARETGATVKESLTLDYINSFAYFTPFRSSWDRHWLVALSSTGHLLALAGIPSLASQMWGVTYSPSSNSSVQQLGTVTFQVVWVRIFQAANGLLFAVLIVMALMLRRSWSLLARDPGGAANVASIICESRQLLHLLRKLPSYASNKNIEHYLYRARFYLRRLDGDDGAVHISVELPEDGKLAELQTYTPSRLEAHPFILWGRTESVILLALLVPNFIVHIGYSGFSTFKPFVVKGAFTLVYSSYTAIYQAIQHELAVFEPYYQMQNLYARDRKRHVPLALNFTPRSLPWMPVLACLSSAPILACASILVLFQHISMIFYPPMWTTIYESRLTRQSLVDPVMVTPAWIVTGTSIVGAVSGAIGWGATTRHRSKPIMPRQPRTLASQMIYLCGSTETLRSMEGTSSMNEKDFQNHCKNLGQEHGFGWFQSSDGQWRIGIETLENMKYAYKYPQTTSPETYDD